MQATIRESREDRALQQFWFYHVRSGPHEEDDPHLDILGLPKFGNSKWNHKFIYSVAYLFLWESLVQTHILLPGKGKVCKQLAKGDGGIQMLIKLALVMIDAPFLDVIAIHGNLWRAK